MSRRLSVNFMDALLNGHLNPLLQRVQRDRDLILEIREDYINIYSKGHNVVMVKYGDGAYPATYTNEFTRSLCPPSTLASSNDVESLLLVFPLIKDQIAMHAAEGNEIEFEQMLIRANNCESRVNSDYFFIDRQIVINNGDVRFDLIGFHWPSREPQPRRRDQKVPLVLAEVKYGCNNDIQELHSQLGQYIKKVNSNMSWLVPEAQLLMQQKTELGLLGDAHGLRDAMQTLSISPELDVCFLIILVDYNPYSKLLRRSLQHLTSQHNVDIFMTGFGLWDRNLYTWKEDG